MKQKKRKLALKKTTVQQLNPTQKKVVEGGTGTMTIERSQKSGTFGCCAVH